jgi:A/G-specific adenine glycosylase
MPDSAVHTPILRWYAGHARDLPWRVPGVGGWPVLVSEVMLQQTPVARVVPAFEAWLRRWPTPAALAADGPGEAVRMWGRLGYPRRALRLHETATVIDSDHGGKVPAAYVALRALPGVGDYTAAAVGVFAFGQRREVLDTNVRRVLARLLHGEQFPGPCVTRAERAEAVSMLPDESRRSAAWSVATMELGALVCTAAAPACPRCPVADLCRWRAAGYPAQPGGPRRGRRRFAGSDRECRGRLLTVLRDTDRPVSVSALEQAWADSGQRARALASLIDDGLVVEAGEGALALP